MKIYYASQVDINDLGATRSVDIPMIKNLRNLGHDIIWIGININNHNNIANRTLSFNQSSLNKFFMRIRNRIYRLLKLETVEHQKLKALKKYDKWQANILEQINSEINNQTLFIGRGVGSELSFKTFKKYGGYCILHSQWMHPDTQKNILENELSKLQIEYTQVLPERISIQKNEIDLCDKIWCISNLVYDSYINNGIPEDKLMLCPLGVDSEIFEPSLKKNIIRKDQFVIIFVGNVNIEKGVHFLLEALLIGQFTNCKLILNGGISEYFKPILNRYIEKLDDLNIEIEFANGFPLDNLQKSDLFILPSLHESFGLTVLEAMSCSLPVIVTNQVGAKDHVKDGLNGFVVDANSSETIAQKINFFYDNPDAGISFGDESRKIAENLNYKYIAERFISSFDIEEKF